MSVYCSFKNCMSYKGKTPNVRFFCFPRSNHERCFEWIRRSGDKTLMDILPPKNGKRQRRVCSLHFPDSAFRNSFKTSLNSNAIPNFYNEEVKNDETNSKTTKIPKEMNLVPENIQFVNCETIEDSTTEITRKFPKIQPLQISSGSNLRKMSNNGEINVIKMAKLCSSDCLSRLEIHKQFLKMKSKFEALKNTCHNLKKQLHRKEIRSKRVQDVIPRKKLTSELKKYIEGVPCTFVKMQLKKAHRATWLPSEKELALSFYETSPDLYKKMLAMHFKMPGIKTVQNWILHRNKVEKESQIQEEIINKTLNKM